jgi:NAD(P)-dependent dehydrogenase (short-subunit alcohol dehydrogenase family)
VINNAGVGVASAPVEEVPDAVLHKVMDTNVFGVLRVIRHVAPALRAQGNGHIINVSSVSGRVTRPFGGPYSAAKYALEALSDALYWELRPFGVRVTLFAPGFLKTDMRKRHVEVPRDATSAYLRDETAFNRTLSEFAGKADEPRAAAQTLADVVDGRLTRRRVVFGSQAQAFLAMSAPLVEDASSATYADAVSALLARGAAT